MGDEIEKEKWWAMKKCVLEIIFQDTTYQLLIIEKHFHQNLKKIMYQDFKFAINHFRTTTKDNYGRL